MEIYRGPSLDVKVPLVELMDNSHYLLKAVDDRGWYFSHQQM